MSAFISITVPNNALLCLVIVVSLIIATLFLNCILHKRWKLIVKLFSKFCPRVKVRKKRSSKLDATKDKSPNSDDYDTSDHPSDNEDDKANENSKLITGPGDNRSIDQSNLSSSHTPPPSRVETASLSTYIPGASRTGSYALNSYTHKLSSEENLVHVEFKISYEETLTQLVVKIEDAVIDDEKLLKGYVSVHGALVGTKTRRFQTRAKRSSSSIIFDQIFVLTNVEISDIETSKLRLRLYHLASKAALMQAKKIVAENIVGLHQLKATNNNNNNNNTDNEADETQIEDQPKPLEKDEAEVAE
ncbi:uncharacterized protein TRIADDRAFT_51433 [Trichoplax adhaerens]|uniref:C2 domain-containing protein n=1 Tax=Trichoplax adhaerens TaxID=10228 RepID=B3RJ72_TRIAD|nr:predicted protein [Trichoplax adhaerens]EDV28480.1 predicted protein [Trichoplax adhaerens]|eukprot:XP_002107682.1 predicted protein [Trichoplax adhaerens]